MRGGRRNGAGRKKAKDQLKKVNLWFRQDQIDSLNDLPKRTKGEFIRAAVDEKFKNMKNE